MIRGPHALEAWLVTALVAFAFYLVAETPVGEWVAYAYGYAMAWSLCAVGLDDPGCATFGF